MPEQPMFGIPEINQQDVKEPLRLVFRLNAILRSLAAQISYALGLSGPVRTGESDYTFSGRVSMQRGATVAGTLVVLGESDRDGNWRAVQVGALSEYADDAAAKAGGLPPGSLYRTASGAVMVVLPN